MLYNFPPTIEYFTLVETDLQTYEPHTILLRHCKIFKSTNLVIDFCIFLPLMHDNCWWITWWKGSSSSLFVINFLYWQLLETISSKHSQFACSSFPFWSSCCSIFDVAIMQAHYNLRHQIKAPGDSVWGRILSKQSVKILAFPSPTGYMMWSFRDLFLINLRYIP